ncbi:MAG: hypothetical protein ACD_72C00529G0002 [uncultured bacterium]|nr:MAG: hypothetical protein ACD_72C00529G0002 [uncultured bacterium]
MAELVTTYELRDPEIPLPMDRDKFYEEQLKVIESTGKPSRAVEIIGLLLFNRKGEIILQKRSGSKVHNPFMIDKAIGGHVKHGDSPLYTLMVETVQELRVPSIVLRNDDDFRKTYKLLETYIDSIAVVKELDKGVWNLGRTINKKNYDMAHNVHLYVGVYSGSSRPSDSEASGILYYNLENLKKEMSEQPGNFTYDLHFYLKKYEKEIEEFLSYIKNT